MALYLFFQVLLHLTQDSRELPAMATAVPFISPILGMMKGNSRYYNYLRDKYSEPIFTLRLPFTRLYIVTSPSLIPAVQRQSRVLSFNLVQLRAVTNFASSSKRAIDLVTKNIDNDEGFVPGFLKAVYPTLTGDMLDTLNQKTVNVILTAFDKMAAADEQITYATTDAIYGPHNPLRDPENLSACQRSQGPHVSVQEVRGVLRTGPTPLAGSDYIQRRRAYMRESGLLAEDVARIKLTGVFPLIGNTIPTTFWLVYHIVSSPIVLEDCRREALQAVSERGGVCTLDASFIKDSFSRFHGMGTSVRLALEDHMLDGKYLIKKGGMVMISGRVQQSSPSLWGRTPGSERHNPVAFRGFGGGTTLCPGRHLATTEIPAGTASSGGPCPPKDKSSQASAMDQPGHDISIELWPRPKQNWRVVFPSKADNKTRIVAEDIQAFQLDK
ncbi:cytochrome P450 [Xylaria palmicola]|nr:cytochrome P450 [Xylaria palmicola]